MKNPIVFHPRFKEDQKTKLEDIFSQVPFSLKSVDSRINPTFTVFPKLFCTPDGFKMEGSTLRPIHDYEKYELYRDPKIENTTNRVISGTMVYHISDIPNCGLTYSISSPEQYNMTIHASRERNTRGYFFTFLIPREKLVNALGEQIFQVK
jgi:hypothetical protein